MYLPTARWQRQPEFSEIDTCGENYSNDKQIPPQDSDGFIKFVYLLPQNKSGELSVYSIMGQLVHKQYLSSWSSLQLMDMSDMSSGIYTCVLTSGTHRTAKKLVVIGGSGAR